MSDEREPCPECADLRADLDDTRSDVHAAEERIQDLEGQVERAKKVEDLVVNFLWDVRKWIP